MKNIKLLTAIAACLLLTSIFTVLPAFSVQPPLDTSTYYIGTIGQPVRLDPARAYDTASGELIQNVYQTLIWYADNHPITFIPGTGYNLTLADYADLTKFKGVLSTFCPNITNGGIVPDGTGGSYWTFTVNTAATWQPWIAANGSTIPSRALTVNDVVYTFRRMLVIEMSGSPNWMFFMPGFGNMGFRTIYSGYTNGTFVHKADEDTVAGLIQGFVYPSGGNNVTFHFQYAWTAVAMYQIFSQTWGSVMNPEWCMEHGDWDGLFTPSASDADMTAGWSNGYRRKPNTRASALDMYKDPAVYGARGSKYVAAPQHDVPSMLGTGPYNFTATNWDQTTKTWRIDAWTGYWGGWAGNHVTTVIEKGIDAWPTRKMLFLEGEFDVVAVPRANMYDILKPATDAYTPIDGVNLVYNIASLSNDVLLFTYNLSATSPYQSYVGYPTHKTAAEPYFFADSNIRNAFAWAFDYASYLADAWFDEAVQQNSWWVDGLAPAAAKLDNASYPMRQKSLTNMQNYLNAAVIDGFNVGTEGFEVTLAYNIGNDQRLIACQLFAQAFLSLGSKYKVNIVGLDWPVFLELRDSSGLAAYDVGWLADFAHPDNFARPYQHSQGDFMFSQGPPYPADQATVDAEIDAAIIAPTEAEQIWYYKDLQYRFFLDAVDIILCQPSGRRFARDWVYGWYFNSLFPGLYAYHIYKSVAAGAQPIDLDVVHTLTPLATWQKVYWYANGTAFVGYTNGVGPANGSRAIYQFSLSMKRTETNGLVPQLIAAVALKRLDLNDTNPATNLFFTAVQLVLLGPGETKTVSLNMEEDGTYATSFPGNHTFALSAVAFVNLPANAFDNDTSNNNVAWGNFKAQGQLIGDLKIDGVVNILDSIVLGLKFGLTQGATGWDPLTDLKADGTINILDSIVLGLNFAKTAPGPQFP